MADATHRSSGWSLHLGRILGIPVRMHVTFLLLVVWYGWESSRTGNDLALSIVFLLAVFGCVVLHELGHATAARGFGVRTREIVLYPIGGVARLDNIPHGKAELVIALAGPAVNVVLAFALGSLIVVLPDAGFALTPTLVDPWQLVGRLFWVNLILFAFNLIPAFPMDGGRVLRAALSMMMSGGRATEVATAVGQGFAVLFALAGIFLPSLVLVLIAAFVFLGASQEAFVYRQQTVVRGRTAAEAMITRYESVAPQDTLARAAEHLLATHQQDFPVIDAWNRVVGVLSRATLLHGLASLGAQAAVLEVMDREVPAVRPGDPLDHVLALLRRKPGSPVIVLDGTIAVGMITLENLTEFIEVSRRAEVERPSAQSR